MGASVAEAAADTGMARQVVHRLMARIRARMEALPADWLKVEVWLPEEDARRVLDLATMLRAALELPAGSADECMDAATLTE